MATFSKNDAKRVAAATKKHERAIRNPRPYRGSGPSGSPLGFYAALGAQSSGHYAWTKIKYSSSGDSTTDVDWGSADSTAETGYAVEAHNKSTECVSGDIVWLYPAMGQDFYIFEYQPGLRIAVSNGSIPARSGSTPGTGAAIIKTLATTYSNNGAITVYNPFSTSVASGQYIEIEWCDGYWHITGVDCGG